jgi:hypothetical protein
MIYIDGKPGKKAYSYLSEVLDLRRVSLKENNDYEILKNMVKETSEQYKKTQNFSRKVTLTSIKFLIQKNQAIRLMLSTARTLLR